MKLKNKLFIGLAIVASVISLNAATVVAVLPQSGVPVINSPAATATNQIFGTTTNGLWPKQVFAGTSVTNVTPVKIVGAHTAIEFDVQLNTASGATNANVILQLGRSVSGQTPTNAWGTNCKIEWFTTITNILPASAVADKTYTSVTLLGPSTGQSIAPADGAVTTLYLGWITNPSGMTVTNYQVYVNSL